MRVEARQWETLGPVAAVQGGEAAARGVDLEERRRVWNRKTEGISQPDAFYM